MLRGRAGTQDNPFPYAVRTSEATLSKHALISSLALCVLEGGLQLGLAVRGDGELREVVAGSLEASSAAGEREEPVFEEGEGGVGSDVHNHAAVPALLRVWGGKGNTPRSHLIVLDPATGGGEVDSEESLETSSSNLVATSLLPVSRVHQPEEGLPRIHPVKHEKYHFEC